MIELLVSSGIVLGMIGTCSMDLVPYSVRVSGQATSLEVFAAGLQVFLSFFSRFFVLLIAPLCGLAFEAKLLSVPEIIATLTVSYVCAILGMAVYRASFVRIVSFFSYYLFEGESRNSYFGGFVVRRVLSKSELPVQFVMSSPELGARFDLRFLVGNILAGAFAGAVIPVIIVTALSFPAYRLTIFSFGPLITFIGAFSNVVLVEKTLALNAQRGVDNSLLFRSFFFGRIGGVFTSACLYLLIVSTQFQ